MTTRAERYAALCKEVHYRYPDPDPDQFALVSWENETSEINTYDTVKVAMANAGYHDNPDEVVDLDTGLRARVKTTYTLEGWE